MLSGRDEAGPSGKGGKEETQDKLLVIFSHPLHTEVLQDQPDPSTDLL